MSHLGEVISRQPNSHAKANGDVQLIERSDGHSSILTPKIKSWLKWGVAVVLPAAALAVGLAFFNPIAAAAAPILFVLTGVCIKLIYDHNIEHRQVNAEIIKAESELIAKQSAKCKQTKALSKTESTAVEPATVKPKTTRSTIIEPATTKPTTIKPETTKPATIEPVTITSATTDLAREACSSSLKFKPSFYKAFSQSEAVNHYQLRQRFKSLHCHFEANRVDTLETMFNSRQTELKKSLDSQKCTNCLEYYGNIITVASDVTPNEHRELSVLKEVLQHLVHTQLPGGAMCQGWINALECFFRRGLYHRVIGTELELQAHADKRGKYLKTTNDGCFIDVNRQAVYTESGYAPVVGLKDHISTIKRMRAFDSYQDFTRTMAVDVKLSSATPCTEDNRPIISERYVLQLIPRNKNLEINEGVINPLVNKGHYVLMVRLPSTGRYIIIDQEGTFPVVNHKGTHYTEATKLFFKKWCPDGRGYVQLYDLAAMNDQELSDDLAWADKILLKDRKLHGKPLPPNLTRECQIDGDLLLSERAIFKESVI